MQEERKLQVGDVVQTKKSNGFGSSSSSSSKPSNSVSTRKSSGFGKRN